MNATIDTKTISQLKDFRFFIPSYQRGYRWTRQEVTALLDDLKEFSDDNGKRKYCLQPLVVKSLSDGRYEVVDGQQRLTTIYIFIKLAADEMKSATPPFSLEYETRENSGAFLSELSSESAFDDSNIDYFHISLARDEMNVWLSRQLDKSLAIMDLYKKILSSTFFVWYELPQESDAITMFTKINLGKIPLTNAELIKALLMSKENFPEGNSADKRQIEISTAWDRIEQGLQESSFWYFLNQNENTGTRIDLLFELLSDEYNDNLENPIPKTTKDYFPFLVFAELQRREKKFVDIVWNDVEALYSELRNWYADLDKYHIVGYLIACGTTIQTIQQATRRLRKSDVRTKLIELTQKSVGTIEWDALEYTGRSADKAKLQKILLLFNIATLVCKSEKQYRFPFDLYKTGMWDLEHIHAVKDELPHSVNDTILYLEALSREFDDMGKSDVACKINKFLADSDKNDRYFRASCVEFYDKLKAKNTDILAEDNPNDPVSLKALFADNTKTELIRALLDSIPTTQPDDIKNSLQKIITSANIPECDWRYCFIRYPNLFEFMSKQYMRIYKGTSTLIIKNIATNGYNIEVFTYTLYLILRSRTKEYFYEPGSYGDHYVNTTLGKKRINIRFDQNSFKVYDADQDLNNPKAIIFQTQKEPLSEIVHYLDNNP